MFDNGSVPPGEALISSLPTANSGGAWAFRQLGRLRVQVLGALLIAVVLPVILRWSDDFSGVLQPIQLNTTVASSLAVIVGLLVLRQLTALPGVNGTFYVIPVLLVSFFAVLAGMLFLRVEYNRYLFPVSFVVTIAWVYFAHFVARRHSVHRLGIVPGGEVDGLTEIKGVEWRHLFEPGVPQFSLTGLVVDLRRDIDPTWERFIADCALAGIRVFHVKQIRESLTGRLEITHLSENTLGSINPDATYLKVKLFLDWVLALIVLLLLWPLFVVLSLAIRLESPGPALFRQARMGFRGRSFSVYKFRTMRTDAPIPSGAGAIEAAMTADGDARITPLGRVLRRTRLDELPQVFNILRGEMSWIGPRPEAMVLSRFYEDQIPFYRYRHIVRPGISGWAQINQGHVTNVDEVHEKLHYDFYYIKNFSPWLDILILLKTVKTILTGFGAR